MDEKLLAMEAEAEALVKEIREAVARAVPLLVKLKRAQFRQSDNLPLIRFILGTDDLEPTVRKSVRETLATVTQTAIKFEQ